jgi:hypothetical protein
MLNDNDVHIRELADMIDRLQPKVSEFLNDFEQIETKQEQLHNESKVKSHIFLLLFYLIKLYLKLLESKCRSEYNSFKQWIDIQQQLERILTKITKDFEQTTQYHTLLQLEEFSENIRLNLNHHDHIENLFQDARLTIQSDPQNLTRIIEKYETRWKDLQQRLNKNNDSYSR